MPVYFVGGKATIFDRAIAPDDSAIAAILIFFLSPSASSFAKGNEETNVYVPV